MRLVLSAAFLSSALLLGFAFYFRSLRAQIAMHNALKSAATAFHLDGDETPGKIYSWGQFQVELTQVQKQAARQGGPPKDLLVSFPKGADPRSCFPMLVLQHGFTLRNMFYSQLMAHISSHGFIVIAPQMYTFSLSTNATGEIEDGIEVIDWLKSTDFSSRIQVKPDRTKLAVCGHSRGGKVAFGMALNASKAGAHFNAVIAVDPVDGMDHSNQTEPKILRYQSEALDIGCPSLIIGTGLGPLGNPPCAPEGVGHKQFFSDSRAPSFHFVARGYGHMDMLDDNTRGIIGWLTYRLCLKGASRMPMRRFTGGMVIAFLKSVFQGNNDDLVDSIDNVGHAFVAIESPEWKGNKPEKALVVSM